MKKIPISFLTLSLALGLIGLFALPFFAKERAERSAASQMGKPLASPYAVQALRGSWGRTYSQFCGGPGTVRSESDMPKAMAMLKDGGLIVAGSASAGVLPSGAYSGIVVARIGPRGGVVWDRLFPAILSSPCTAFPFDLAAGDDGCLVVGEYVDPSYDVNNTRALVISLGLDGRAKWANVYSSGRGDSGGAVAVVKTSDGGFAIAGSASIESDGTGIFVARLNQAGEVSWSKMLSGADLTVTGMVENPDGGLVVAGYTYEYNSTGSGGPDWECSETYVLKLSPEGRLLWQRKYAPRVPCVCCENSEFVPNSMAATSDGGLILIGRATAAGLGGMWVLKLSGSGAIGWQRMYRGAANGHQIVQTLDGGYLAVGGYPASAIKLSPKGVPLWGKEYGAPTFPTFSIQDAGQKPDGGYAMLIWTLKSLPPPTPGSDFEAMPLILLSTDSNGNFLQSTCRFTSRLAADSKVSSVRATPTNLVVKPYSLAKSSLTFAAGVWPPVTIKGLCVQ